MKISPKRETFFSKYVAYKLLDCANVKTSSNYVFFPIKMFTIEEDYVPLHCLIHISCKKQDLVFKILRSFYSNF